jgi:hypothetical protein
VIELRRVRWAGHVARRGRRGAYRVLVGKLEEGGHLEDLSVDGRIIVKFIFEKWGGCMELNDLA